MPDTAGVSSGSHLRSVALQGNGPALRVVVKRTSGPALIVQVWARRATPADTFVEERGHFSQFGLFLARRA
jgi:hypothetical protein